MARVKVGQRQLSAGMLRRGKSGSVACPHCSAPGAGGRHYEDGYSGVTVVPLAYWRRGDSESANKVHYPSVPKVEISAGFLPTVPGSIRDR